MPSFTTGELTQLGYISLDFYLKNNPIDQVATEHPWLRKLTSKKKSFPGGKENVVEQIRTTYDGNLTWYFGDDTVSYNRRDTIRQASYPWGGWHDGFSLNEDLLLANGITITDGDARGGGATNSEADMLQLTNLFEENSEALRLGCEELFDRELHRDGTQDSKAIAGLDSLVAVDPTTGTVGSINRATAGNEYWRNQYVSAGVAQASLVSTMETKWRACMRNGGTPDFIMAGSDAVDDFRAAAQSAISRYTVQQNAFDTPTEFDPSTRQNNGGTYTGLHFQGVPIVWNPVFEDLDTLDSPTPTWEKRIYFINCKHMKLRPAAGHDMIPRTPPRNANAYVHYWGLTWKGALTMNRANCHSVIYID